MEFLDGSRILVFVSLFALLISKCNKEVSHRSAPVTFRLMLPCGPGARWTDLGPSEWLALLRPDVLLQKPPLY